MRDHLGGVDESDPAWRGKGIDSNSTPVRQVRQGEVDSRLGGKPALPGCAKGDHGRNGNEEQMAMCRGIFFTQELQAKVRVPLEVQNLCASGSERLGRSDRLSCGELGFAMHAKVRQITLVIGVATEEEILCRAFWLCIAIS